MCYLVSTNNEINPVLAMLPPLCVRAERNEISFLVAGKSRTKKWGLLDKIRFYVLG